jgi:hypothetical protein
VSHAYRRVKSQGAESLNHRQDEYVMFKLRASVKLQVYDSVGINKEKKASVYGHRDIGDMNQIRSKAQVSRSEHKSDYNTASISNTASILEFPSQISRSRVQDAALITSKQEACTGHASYLNIMLACICVCMHARHAIRPKPR